MSLYANDRSALFIDGANLYAAARSLGFDIDYKQLLNYFKKDCRLIRAFYYTALLEDQEYSPIRPLVDWLDYNGYTLKWVHPDHQTSQGIYRLCRAPEDKREYGYRVGC